MDTNTRRSPSRASAAARTSSPSFRSMTLQESMVVGDSRFQRLTTPLRVPSASGAGSAPSPSLPASSTEGIAMAAITRSPRIGLVFSVMPSNSSAFTPPETFNGPSGATAGNSTTCANTRRPAEVISPYEERVVVRKIETIWSSLVRASEPERFSQRSTESSWVRAIRPVALSITAQGSSSICKAVAVALSSPAFFAAFAAAATSAAAEDTVAAVRAAASAVAETPSSPCAVTGTRPPSASSSNSTVRRGVPYAATASSISSITTPSKASLEARMRSSSSMRCFRSSRSASSSIRLIFVRRRRRKSRMYCA